MDRLTADEAESSPPPAASRGMGALLGRAKKAIFGEREEKTEAAPPTERRTQVGLVGRVVLAKGREIVIEIVLTAPLAWNALLAGPRPVMTFATGTTLEATVDPARTTREGSYAPGVTLRLVVLLDRDPGSDMPATVGLQLPGGWTMIALER